MNAKEPMAGFPKEGPRNTVTISKDGSGPRTDALYDDLKDHVEHAQTQIRRKLDEQYLNDRYDVPQNKPPVGYRGHAYDEPLEDRPASPHYSVKGGPEPIDLIHALNLDFDEGNVVKYVSRWRRKDGVQDLYKARVYLNWLISRAEKEQRSE